MDLVIKTQQKSRKEIYRVKTVEMGTKIHQF